MLVKSYEVIVGEWYKKGTGRRFEIIAMDDNNDLIEIKYYDGTVEEIKVTDWDNMRIVMSEPPEAYYAEPQTNSADYGMALEDQHPESWHENPLDAIL